MVLGEKAEGTTLATRDNVRAAFADLKNRMKPVDLLLVVLFGHGTFDGVDAKFNLVGPDLDTAEWKALIGGVPGHVVFVSTTSASFPFLERLSGSNRIVITATDSEAQKYQTVFPEFFAKAFDDEAADLDKDGRVSLWKRSSTPPRPSNLSTAQRGRHRPSAPCSTTTATAWDVTPAR
ncbi:MAG: hypothetical protein U0Q12_03480 [Vicinamibacterales bacterium]